MPDILFVADDTFEHIEKIDGILKRVSHASED